MERAILVYTTYPSVVEAERAGRAIVERRLAACVNILPGMVSHYWWQGRIERGVHRIEPPVGIVTIELHDRNRVTVSNVPSYRHAKRVKLAVAYAFIGIIGSEFILSRGGIGYEINFAYNNFDNATMYPLIVLILLASIAINTVLTRWEKTLLARRGAR